MIKKVLSKLSCYRVNLVDYTWTDPSAYTQTKLFFKIIKKIIPLHRNLQRILNRLKKLLPKKIRSQSNLKGKTKLLKTSLKTLARQSWLLFQKFFTEVLASRKVTSSSVKLGWQSFCRTTKQKVISWCSCLPIFLFF